MPDTPPPIFPPNSVEDVVAQVASLPLNAYDALRTEIRSIDGFEADKIRSDSLAARTSLRAENIAIILSVLSFLYARVNAIAGGGDIEPIVRGLVEGLSSERFNTALKADAIYRLRQLLEISSDIELSRKIQRLRNGFLNNASAFASFVDARPVFDESNDSIKGFISVVQFRITTDVEGAEDSEFIFQMDGNGLAALKAAVEAAEKKLKTLGRADALTAPLYQSKN